MGYERLRIYFLSRRQLALPGRPFRANTSYKEILRIYECDARLRDVCFDACGQFELLLRNAISEELSRRFGSHPYSFVSAFKDAKSRRQALVMFSGVYDRSKDARARHYLQTYDEPILPPIWILKEFLTFGSTSYLLQYLSGPVRNAIAIQFGVRSDDVFLNWITCLVDLRNACAHHDRLFNRSFQKQPRVLTAAATPSAPNNKLKAILECLDYMAARRGAPTSVTNKVASILNRYSEITPAEAGF